MELKRRDRPKIDSTFRRGPSRAIKVIGVLIAILVILVLAHRPILAGMARLLDVSEEPTPSDLIFVLGGGYERRSIAAAELHRRGLADQIAIVREAEGPAAVYDVQPTAQELSKQLLIRLGVPAEEVEIVSVGPDATSTRDDALQLDAYLRSHPANKIILVTDDYHTRRARWQFRRHVSADDIEWVMVGVPNPVFSEDNWWEYEQGLLTYVEEYLKYVHNLIYR